MLHWRRRGGENGDCGGDDPGDGPRDGAGENALKCCGRNSEC